MCWRCGSVAACDQLTEIKGQTRKKLPGDQSTQFSILKPA